MSDKSDTTNDAERRTNTDTAGCLGVVLVAVGITVAGLIAGSADRGTFWLPWPWDGLTSSEVFGILLYCLIVGTISAVLVGALVTAVFVKVWADEKSKMCPDCKSKVPVDARVCRFCRYEFAGNSG